MIQTILKTLCYRDQHVTNVDFDPITGTILMNEPIPEGLRVTIGYIHTDTLSEPVRIASVSKTVPRRWFKPLDTWLKKQGFDLLGDPG